jgi:LysM repeat protein
MTLKDMSRKMQWIAVALASLAVLVLAGLCALAFWLARQQEQARSQFAPPTVLVTEPASGESVPLGKYVFVSATGFGRTPISRMELWVDGEAAEIEESDLAEGISPFYAHFGFPASEGPHMVFVRAVNAAGIIGQSLPVALTGESQLDPQGVQLVVRAQAGDTLADLAEAYGSDAGTLQELNPQLGDQEPAPDTVVFVPAPPEELPPPSLGPAVPPSAPGSTPPVVPDAPALKIIEPAALPLDLPVGFLAASPPAAPTDLEAQVLNCKVRLRWNDKASNEESYVVRMAGLRSPGRVIATLQPAASGAAWVEIEAPQPGYLSFWVEAVNRLGRQPSNIVWVYVEPTCPTAVATHLQVEALDMALTAAYDTVYCYISFEGAAEVRIPGDDSAFVQVQSQQADIAAWAGGSHAFVVPIPEDRSLEITGKCLGWSGARLDFLGSLSGNYVADTWDGKRRSLRGGAVEIGVAIEPLGALDATGTRQAYAYDDPSLPVPYDVREDQARSAWGDTDPLERQLSWKWDGDPASIDGFQILLNGAPYNLGWLAEPPLVSPAARTTSVRLPQSCGEHVFWQVAAIAGPAQSRLSARSPDSDYDLPDCQLFAVVTFNTLEMSSDDTVDTWYSIYANNIEKRYWNDTFRMPLTRGTYTFRDLSAWPHYYDWPPYNVPSTDSIVVPLSSDPSPSLSLGYDFRYWCWFWGLEDDLCWFEGSHDISMTREEWTRFEGDVGSWAGSVNSNSPSRVDGYVRAHVRGFATPLP